MPPQPPVCSEAMPLYEYRCRQCDEIFEARRGVDQADLAPSCPQGHLGAVRLLSVFASTGRASVSAPTAATGAPCGAACACHPG